MNKFIDILGNELKVGDRVITVHQGYEELVVGTIIKFTPKKIYVEHMYIPTQQPIVKLKTEIQVVKI